MPEGEQLGTVGVGVGADASELKSELEGAAKELEKFGGKMETAGKTMSDAGGELTKLFTVPIAAAGTGLLVFANQFDSAFDKIRIETGATGSEFAGLQDDFRAVFESVPAGFDEVATAVAGFNTVLGLSGQPLQDLARQTVELSRITGTDLKANVDAAAHAFNNWGVEVKDQTGTMDMFFRASQASGVGVTELIDSVAKFGPQLRAMGLDITESTALLAVMDKAGIDSGRALAGIGIAARQFAQDNIPVTEGLRATLQRMQELGPGAESTKLAFETFGRSGLAMADAIASGKLSVEDMMTVLAGSDETILGAADATNDFGEKLMIMRNQVFLAAEPLATKLLDVLNNLMPTFQRVIDLLIPLVDWFAKLPTPVLASVGAVLGLVAAIGPVLWGLGQMVTSVGVLTGALGKYVGSQTAATVATSGWSAKLVGVIPLLTVLAGAFTEIKRNADGSASSVEKWLMKFNPIGPLSANIRKVAGDWDKLMDNLHIGNKITDAVGDSLKWVAGTTDDVSEASERSARQTEETTREWEEYGNQLIALGPIGDAIRGTMQDLANQGLSAVRSALADAGNELLSFMNLSATFSGGQQQLKQVTAETTEEFNTMARAMTALGIPVREVDTGMRTYTGGLTANTEAQGKNKESVDAATQAYTNIRARMIESRGEVDAYNARILEINESLDEQMERIAGVTEQESEFAQMLEDAVNPAQRNEIALKQDAIRVGEESIVLMDDLIGKIQDEGEAISDTNDKMNGFINEVSSGFFPKLKGLWNDLGSTVGGIMGPEGGLTKALGGFGQTLLGFVGPAGPVLSMVQGFGELFGVNLVGLLQQALGKVGGAIMGALHGIWEGIKNFFGGGASDLAKAYEGLDEAGRNLLDFFVLLDPTLSDLEARKIVDEWVKRFGDAAKALEYLLEHMYDLPSGPSMPELPGSGWGYTPPPGTPTTSGPEGFESWQPSTETEPWSQTVVLEIDGYKIGSTVLDYGVRDARLKTGLEVY